MTQPRLIAIVGPTGTGKSELSLQLANHLQASGTAAEVVNADAMQLYRGMDIGTAKLPQSAWRGVPHHLFDVLDVSEEAAVARYQPLARETIAEIHLRGAVPILVGGSGLYVSSVIYDFQFPGTDPLLRSRLEQLAADQGAAELHARLTELDPAAAASIGPTNTRRLVRALEVIELTGSPMIGALPQEPVLWMPTVVLGLQAPRAELTARLDERVEGMWRDGILDEVRSLVPHGLEDGVTARRAIGYAQALDQLHGRSSEADAIAQTQQLTRRYARRQMSWFRRYPSIAWLDYDDPQLLERALARL
jgi:tRNA dimethylallyltransferase